MRALLLSGDAVPHTDTYKYDVIVASYHCALSEHTRSRKFLEVTQDYNDQKSDRLPKRPMMTLFSGGRVEGSSYSMKLTGSRTRRGGPILPSRSCESPLMSVFR